MNTKKQIAKLTTMKLNELQSKYAEVIGEKTRSPNRKFLIRKITEALQAASGSVGEKAASPSASAAAETAVATNTTAAPVAEQVAEIVPEKLTKLTVPELQARYLEVVGRPTGSSNSAYLDLENPRGAQRPHRRLVPARTPSARASPSRSCPCAWRPRSSTSSTRPGSARDSTRAWISFASPCTTIWPALARTRSPRS